jgi:hypothetical protein
MDSINDQARILLELKEILSRLENLQRSSDKTTAAINGLDLETRLQEVLREFGRQADRTLQHIETIEKGRAVEREMRVSIASKVAAELWQKGGQYIVLGASLLLVGAVAKYLGLPVPFFGQIGGP